MKYILDYEIESKPKFSKKYGKFSGSGTLKSNSFEELTAKLREMRECFKDSAKIVFKNLSSIPES